MKLENKGIWMKTSNKRMQGTPQPYLSSVAGVGLAASPNVNCWSRGAPDAHADMRRSGRHSFS